MQCLHILEREKKLNGRFPQFSNFADTAVLPCTAVQCTITAHPLIAKTSLCKFFLFQIQQKHKHYLQLLLMSRHKNSRVSKYYGDADIQNLKLES